MAIVRDLLRDQVRRSVMDLIVQGDLPANSRINERTLAEELGVSRTPLREALMNLQIERFVESSPGKGFSVAPLTAREIREVYPIVAALESLALRTSDPPLDVGRLATINDELLANQDDPEHCHQIDERFHGALVENCSNERLLELIKGQKRVMHRYEYAYMRMLTQDGTGPRTIQTSVEEHRHILNALDAGDIDGAAEALTVNWIPERIIEVLGVS